MLTIVWYQEIKQLDEHLEPGDNKKRAPIPNEAMKHNHQINADPCREHPKLVTLRGPVGGLALGTAGPGLPEGWGTAPCPRVCRASSSSRS